MQPAEFADGGASGLSACPAALGRTYRVQLVRSGSPQTPPFDLDAETSIIVTGSDGRSRRIAGTTRVRVLSHRSGPDGFESVDLTGRQIASLDFPLPADLPPDRYDIVLASSIQVRRPRRDPRRRIFSDLGDRAKSCQVLTTVVAGTWQSERTFSLGPTEITTWPEAFRASAKDGRLALGMTHAMVAAVWGFPSEFGSPVELARLPFWDYGMFASVHFVGDRVSEIDIVDRDAPARPGSKRP